MEIPHAFHIPNAALQAPYYFGGTSHSILLSAADTDGTLGLVLVDVPAGEGPPPHIHGRESEAFYVASGTFEFWLDGAKKVRTAGQRAFVPAGVAHTFKNVGDETGRLYVVMSPGGFEGYFAACGTAAPTAIDEALIGAMMASAPAFNLTFLPPPGA